MATYALLDQAEEDALHKSRLLNVEEKPFKRITKRLLSSGSLITTFPTLPPTPPPDASAADEAAAAQEKEKQQQIEERRQWREDTLLDFAAFESSIVRIQFLLTSNIKERDRYATEKLKIQTTAQAVRENTSDLRVQLQEAQATLALRKEYDETAEKITNNRSLRPREDQHINLAKLKAEIADLEKESQEYAHTWAERRQQFGKIIEEGMQLRRLIRDEKEEVERREGMQEREDGEDEHHSTRSGGGATPHRDVGGMTPMHNGGHEPEFGTHGGLVVEKDRFSRGRSPLQSSQAVDEVDAQKQQVEEDEEMAEDGELANEPEGVAAEPVGLVVVGSGGTGPQVNSGKTADQMDIS